MKKFLETVVNQLTDITEGAVDTVGNMCDGFAEAFSNRKEFAKEVNRFHQLVNELGKRVYEDHSAGALICGGRYMQTLMELDSCVEKIQQLNEDWQAAKEEPEYCCSECGKQVEESMQFCPSCGHKLVKKTKCKNCGEDVAENSAFCHKCGNKL